jgi:hypothetical protein
VLPGDPLPFTIRILSAGRLSGRRESNTRRAAPGTNPVSDLRYFEGRGLRLCCGCFCFLAITKESDAEIRHAVCSKNSSLFQLEAKPRIQVSEFYLRVVCTYEVRGTNQSKTDVGRTMLNIFFMSSRIPNKKRTSEARQFLNKKVCFVHRDRWIVCHSTTTSLRTSSHPSRAGSHLGEETGYVVAM